MTDDSDRLPSAPAPEPPPGAEPEGTGAPPWLHELLLGQQVAPLPDESRDSIWHAAIEAIAEHDPLGGLPFEPGGPAAADLGPADDAGWADGGAAHGDWWTAAADDSAHDPLTWPGSPEQASAEGENHLDGGHW